MERRHCTHTTHQKHHIDHNPWIMREAWKDNKGFVSNNYDTQWGAMLNYTVFLLFTTSKLAISLKTKGINIKPLGVIPHTPTLGVCAPLKPYIQLIAQHTPIKKLHQYKRPFKTGTPTTPTSNKQVHQQPHLDIIEAMNGTNYHQPNTTKNNFQLANTTHAHACTPIQLQMVTTHPKIHKAH